MQFRHDEKAGRQTERHCEYFSDGCTQGKLYEVNGYPGAIESDNPRDKVCGELYRIISSAPAG